MKAKIPYKQALTLGDLFSRASEVKTDIATLQARLSQHQAVLQILIGVLGLPLDKGFKMKIEDGPDKDGNVTVTWKKPPPPKE